MPFKANADRRHRIPRQRFKVTNWRDYDASLCQRGSLTVWFTDEAIASWKADPRTIRGGQQTYSGMAILTALTLRAVFRLALRQTEGLIGSVIGLLGLDLAVPDHSTLSRRAATVEVPRPRASPGTGSLHLLVDSTGLKLCGAGEWLHERHGTRVRRSWRKLHLGVDAGTGRIVASLLTTRNVDDGSQVDPLLDRIEEPLASFIHGQHADPPIRAPVAAGSGGQGATRARDRPAIRGRSASGHHQGRRGFGQRAPDRLGHGVSSEDHRQIIAYLLPGDFCDLHVFILDQMDHTITTLSECLVVDIPRHETCARGGLRSIPLSVGMNRVADLIPAEFEIAFLALEYAQERAYSLSSGAPILQGSHSSA